MMGDGVLTKDVFIAFTVGQGANVVNAIEALGVIVVLCCAHRLNTVVVVWMLGIGGTVNTCRSKPMEVLMTKLAACVGKFSHSDVNSSELKVLQELVTQFSKIYEQLIRRISTLLDPWRKTLSKQKCVNGSPDVKQLAINELKDVADLFEGSAPQQTTVPAASASAPAPAPASALAPAPAPPPAPVPGGHGATGPLAKKPRMLSVTERRRANSLAAAGSAGAAGDEAESGSGPSITHKVRVLQELTRYVAEGVELEEDGFSLPGFWRRRGSPKLSQATGEVIEEAAMPHLALLARLYHGVEATSCQAERKFPALALLIGNMRSSMGAFKVEQMMFLRLNQRCFPEFAAYNRVIDRQQARRNQCREDTDKVQNEGCCDLIEIDL